MRTLEDIQKEYTAICAQLGDFEIKRMQARSQILAKVLELDAEANKVKEVQAELEKQKAAEEAAKAAAEPVVDQVVELDGKKYAVEGHLSPTEAEAAVKERLAQQNAQ